MNAENMSVCTHRLPQRGALHARLIELLLSGQTVQTLWLHLMKNVVNTKQEYLATIERKGKYNLLRILPKK
jgi:hypothetical protein